MSAFTTVAALFVAAFAGLYIRQYFQKRGKNFPPGPPGDPLIGHVRHIPPVHTHTYYAKLNKEYGDLVYIEALGQPIIVIGSYEVANELLGKRGVIYSDRPPLPFADVNLDLELLVPTAPYGAPWKEERRMYHNHLSKEAIAEFYRTDIDIRAQEYVLKSLEAKKNISTDYDIAVQKTFINSMYGIQIMHDHEHMLEVSLVGTEIGSIAVIPARFLVNIFPWLMHVPKWFPGAGWKHTGEEWRKVVTEMAEVPYNIVKKAEAEGTAKPSFALQMMREETTLDEKTLMKTGASTFIAGLEPTVATVQLFIYAMIYHPHVYKKLQEEIDNVVGTDRLPAMDDAARLPYLEAVIKELLRWHPASPISVPHRVVQDDVYNGYFIPKGSIVVQNTWSIAMDEAVYPNPDKFIPERFLVDNPPMDPRDFIFGVGRRTCPGNTFGENVFMPAIMTIIATADIGKAIDDNGKEIPVELKTTGRLANPPLAFEFKLTSRHENAISMLHDAVDVHA